MSFDTSAVIVVLLGDAVSYATAKRRSEPLLFKGEDLAATDIRAAV